MASEGGVGVSRVIILPGNGCDDVRQANWYHTVATELETQLQRQQRERGWGESIKVVLEDMPDPYVARRDVWLPFIKKELGCDENTILIGHSSGAVAIMRLLEEQKVRGAILVSACHTDLGDENERESGYYTGEWQWERIKANADWIVQYGSADDPFIPKEEMDLVHEKLGTEYLFFKNRGHFMTYRFPDLVELVMKKLEAEMAHK